MLLLVACGIDNEVTSKGDPTEFTGETGDFTLDTDTAEETVPPEQCNGVDDDGDGEVDEGFDDLDANGRADCLDVECPEMTVSPGGAVAQTEACEGDGVDPVEDAFAVRIQWQFEAPSSDPGLSASATAPLVVNLDDDDGDGDIDEDDVPEVVMSVFGGSDIINGALVAIDGATGLEKWVVSGMAGVVTPVVGDFDADGSPDVATLSSAGRVVCYDGDGVYKWSSADSPSDSIYGVLDAADLDGDGIAEIFADDLVVDGDDGDTRFRMSRTVIYTGATAADIDLDGRQELLFGGTVWDADGNALWSSGMSGTSGWPVVIQADSDDEAEVGWVGNSWELFEHDGTEIFSTAVSTLHPGPPCAGDFDGDGAAEVAWPTGTALVLAELDGSIVWQVPSTDASGLSGCSGYDLDGDGALEVLYADEISMTIYDGRTGASLYSNTDHSSGTLYEYPTVADIDHDGHAEILFVSNFQTTPFAALTVLEHDGSGWPRSGTTWGTHDFSVTNIEPDGSIPAEPEPSWLSYNLFRARPAVDEPAGVDLAVAVVDVCVADCDYGPAEVQVQVANHGLDDVSAGVILSLYAERSSGRELVLTDSLPPIPAGSSLDGLVYELGVGQIGELGYTARIDDDGSGDGDVDECDEDNNEDAYLDSWCP